MTKIVNVLIEQSESEVLCRIKPFLTEIRNFNKQFPENGFTYSRNLVVSLRPGRVESGEGVVGCTFSFDKISLDRSSSLYLKTQEAIAW